MADPYAAYADDVAPAPAPAPVVPPPQPAVDPYASYADPTPTPAAPVPQTFHQERLAQLGPAASAGFYDSLSQNAQAEQQGNQARQYAADGVYPFTQGRQFAQLQQRLTDPAIQPQVSAAPSLGRNTVAPPAQTDLGAATGFGQGLLNHLNSTGAGLARLFSDMGVDDSDPGSQRDKNSSWYDPDQVAINQNANDAARAVQETITDRQASNEAHAGAMKTGDILGGLGDFMVPGGPLIEAAGAYGNRAQAIQDAGGSGIKSAFGGLADAAVTGALPGVGGAAARGLAPMAERIMGAITPIVGPSAASRIAGSLTGATENVAITAGQNVAEAGINAGVNGNLDTFKQDALGDPDAMLGFTALGTALGFLRGHVPHAAPTPEQARLEALWVPHANAPADRAIQPAPGGALGAPDVAELRTPAPEFQRPTPEQVAADSTPEADRLAFEKAKTDPLDDFDPEQIGRLARADGGQQTALDLGTRDRMAAQYPTEELPPPEAAHAEPAPAPERAEGRPEAEATPEAQAAAESAGITVDRTRDVPLGGGISEDGKTVYIDRGIPRTVDLPDGRKADVDASLIQHETAEHGAMRLGEDYATAHEDTANPAENAHLQAQGVKPEEFNAALQPHLDAAADRARTAVQSGTAQNLPPDLHPKHVAASAAEGLIDDGRPRGAADGQAAPQPGSAAGNVPRPMVAKVPDDHAAQGLPVGQARAVPEALPRGAAPPVPVGKVTKAGAKALGHSNDILDDIREAGGILPRPSGHAGGEYDRPKMPLAHAKLISGKIQPDVMAKTLADQGIGDGTTNGMWKAVEKASDARLKPPSDANEEPGPTLDKRPDLANPLESERARNAYVEHRNQQGTPEVRKQADVREAAKANIAKDFEGEYNRLRSLGESHTLMDDHDVASAQEMLQQLWDKGHHEDFERLARVYQVGGTEQARGLAMRADRIQSPQGRLGEARSQAVLNKSEARIQDRLEKAMAPLKEQIAELTRQHAQMAAAAKRAGKVGPSSGRVARQQFKATLAKWGRRFVHGGGPASANAFLEGAYEIVRDGVKAGILSFPDLARAAAQGIRAMRHDPEAHKALEQAWDETQGKDATMEARTGGVKEAVASDPAMSLEQRIADAQKRYDGLAEYKRKMAADLAAMTPEQRVTFMEGEAVAKEPPPALKAVQEAGNKQLRELDAEIAKLSKGEKEAPAEKEPKPERIAARDRIKTLQEQRDAVRNRLGEQRFRLQLQRDRLAAMSHEDRLAEARNRKPPIEVSLDEADARKELASLRRERDTLREPPEIAGPKISRQLQAAKDRMARMIKEYKGSQARSAARNARDRLQLKRWGYDIDSADPEWTHAPGGFENFQAALASVKGGWGDIARENYVGLLHMSSGVAGKKFLSDALVAPPTYVAQRIVEALANLVPGKRTADGADLVGAGKALARVLPAVGKGMVNGFKTWITEKTPEHLKSKDSPEHYPVMRGVTGYLARHAYLLTTVRAMDVAARTFISHMEVANQAHRSAIDAEGKRLTGDAYAKHVAMETGNYLSESWNKARTEAMERTYTNKNDPLTSGINRLKYMDTSGNIGKKLVKLGANFAFPIVGIPAKIALSGIKHWTPGLSDVITIAKALTRDPKSGEWVYDRNKFNGDVARATLRWGLTAGLVSAFNNGAITGHDDKNHPNSVHLFGKWLSVKEVPGLNWALPTVADWMHGGAGTAGKEALRRIGETPWVRPISDLLYAYGAQDKDGWTKYLASKVPVPSVYRQNAAADQDFVQNRTGVAEGDALQRFMSYVRDNVNATYPAKTSEGIPIERDSIEGHPTLTKLFRMLSPMQMGTKETPEGAWQAAYKGSQAPVEQLNKLKHAAKVGGRQEDDRAADRYEDDNQDAIDHAKDLRDVQKNIMQFQDDMKEQGADVKGITGDIRTEALRGMRLIEREKARRAISAR